MNVFSGIRKKVDELGEEIHRIDAILTHPKWVVRGYMFLVERNHKFYMLVNQHDLEVAIARLPSKTIQNIDTSHIFNIPVYHDETSMTSVINGVFRWASKL